MPGFSLGQKWKDKLGMRASFTAELVFDGRARAGSRTGSARRAQGTLQMMRNLEIERLTLAAMSLGIAQRCARGDGRLRERAARASACRSASTARSSATSPRASPSTARRGRSSTTPRGAWTSAPPGSASAADAAKLFASQVGKRVADAAIQVLGGYGYMGEYVVERLWRDAKLLEIGGGTLEAHQKNLTKDLARNPGLVRS